MNNKSLSGSVGRTARNLIEDVRLVQYLLNCVPLTSGGPTRELLVDGVCGPRTVRAIFRFRRALHGPTGARINPNRQVFRALLAHDPYPSQPLPPAAMPTQGRGSTGPGTAVGRNDRVRPRCRAARRPRCATEAKSRGLLLRAASRALADSPLEHFRLRTHSRRPSRDRVHRRACVAAPGRTPLVAVAALSVLFKSDAAD